MNKHLVKLIGLLLAVALVFTGIPLEGFAALSEEIASQSQTQITLPEADYTAGNTESPLRLPDTQDSEQTYEETLYGDPVEVNEYSKVYKIDENTFSSVYSSVPNFYYDKKGNANEYDNSLTYSKGFLSSGKFTNKSSDIDVSFSTDMLKKGMTFEKDGVKIKLIPTQGDYSKYVIVDNAVRYNDVYDGVDIQYAVHQLGVKEDIILTKCVDKTEYSYKLESYGNDVEIIDNVLYVKGKNSDTSFTVSAPVMTDNAGNISDAVTLTYDGTYVKISVDGEWLKSPQRAYPVYIDPNIEVRSGIELRSVVESGDRVYISAVPYAYGYAGYINGNNFGFSGTLGRSRILVHIADGYFNDIPSGAEIKDARFNIYQYVSPRGSTTEFCCNMITDSWDISSYSQSNQSKGYTRSSKLNVEMLSSSKTKAGWHNFDISYAVNHWVEGLDPQYGLTLTSRYNSKTETGGAFVTNTSSASAEGQSAYFTNKPYISVTWEVPNPVDLNYSLNSTTINLRTISTSSKDGKLAILGVFADGIAKPYSTVSYTFSDSAAKYQTGITSADISYKYPDSTAWNDTFASQGRATKYKNVISNWQTATPFVDFEFNKVYNWTAKATLNGETGNTAKSVDFLVYKITRYDTLASIANYYGVSIDKLATDNHVQDMLLMENNTIIVINPTKNANIPYNPGELTDSEKEKIDSMLIGRSKHCEFGFEPVNLNTGNFYMEKTDISIDDVAGEFSISRTYNSKSADINSMFGRGWQFEYAQQLSKLGDGTIVYRRDDGSSIYFADNGDGTYSCDSGYYYELTPIKVATKLGDFGAEALEEYDVYEYEIKDASGEIKRFTSSGLLSYIVDSKGFKTSISYDDNYSISAITSPSGLVYSIKTDASGHIASVTTPDGKKLKYSYSESGDLVSFTNELGFVTTYNYSSDHLMTSWSDPEGNVIAKNVYDSDGRVIKQIDADSNITLFEYGENFTVTKDANGNITRYNYDDSYRTKSIVYPDGSCEYKFYDSDNNLSKEIDRAGNATTYEYNADGLVTKKIRFDGAYQSFAYDKNNNLIKSVDYDSSSISYTYDSKGNLISQTDKNGAVTTYKYDSKSRVTEAKDALGNVTKYEYGDIWVSKVTDSNGNTTEYNYDKRGNVISTVDALGNITRYSYDAAGRKISCQMADGSTESYTYDKTGCMTAMKNANGYTYTYQYNAMGKMTEICDPLGNKVKYTYDGLYNLISTSYGNDNVEKNEYNALSLVTATVDEEGARTENVYDVLGNLIKTTDPEGNTTTYTYDLRFNKVSSKTDALGNTTRYEYDSVGNLIREIDTDSKETVYSYDSCGNLVKVTTPDGLCTEYTYNAIGNLILEKSNAGTNTTYTYDKLSNLIGVTYANLASLTYTYDAMNRKLSEKDSLGATTVYTYDALGRTKSVTDTLGRKTEYEYDGIGNVISEKTDAGKTTYTYDALGRKCVVTDALGNSTYYEYDSFSNLISTTNAVGAKTSFEYSKTGLVTKQTDAMGGIFTFTYDKNGNVTKAKDASGYEAKVEYDALGRTAKTIDALGLVTTYKYDKLSRLVEEKNNNGVTNKYEYDSASNLVKSIDSLGQETIYEYDKNGNVLSVTTHGSEKVTYTYNALGNVTSVTDAEGKKTEYKLDKVGNVISQTDSTGRAYTYIYDKVGRQIESVDPLGQVTKYEYNSFDLLTKQTNPDGTTVTKQYDNGGNLIKETDENDNSTSYSYDKVYRLISVAYADGSSEKYEYDLNDSLTKYTDANGNVTRYTYTPLGYTKSVEQANGAKTEYKTDAGGNVLEETDALGSVTSYVYDKEGKLITKVLPNTATYTYTYDTIGRLITESKPEGLSTSYRYNSYGDIESQTDQSGRTTRYKYDSMHRIISSTDAEGNTTRFSYDSAGNLDSLTSAKGYVTTYKYDVLDRITQTLSPEGKTEVYSYDPVGNLLSVTENGGRVTSYTYDGTGNMLSTTNAAGFTRYMKYDAKGRLVSQSDYKNRNTTYTYDKNGNVLSETDRRGNTTTYTYDSVNNLISQVDAQDRSKSYGYDLLGRVTSVTEDGKYTSEFAYDSVGNLIAGAGYIYTYDLGGNLTASMNALGDITSYIYNSNGMLEKVKNADGSTVSYDYDKLDEMISKKYDGETVALYGYDKDGNRVSMEDITGSTNYEYDKVGRVKAVILSDGKSKITYDYDVYGNLIRLGYPDGTSVEYKYDELNQLVSLKNTSGESTAYKYDANGNVTQVHRPNGTYTQIEYNENDQVKSLINYGTTKFFVFFKKTIEISSYKYEYDKSGNIVKETIKTFSSTDENDFFTWLIAQIKKESTVKEYTYDGRNQLVKVDESHTNWIKTKHASTSTYEYDASGNRTKSNENDDSATYEYNDAGQLVSMTNSDGTTEYEYDKNGNLISEKSPACLGRENAKKYSYDNENRLKTVTENGTLLMAALYDGDGERIFAISKHDRCTLPCCNDKSCKNLSDSGTFDVDESLISDTVFIPNGVKKSDYSDYDLTAYINDANREYTQVLMEYGANGKTTSSYEYGVFRESAVISGERYYYEYDGSNSVSALVNAKGKNTTTYSYTPYGVTEVSGSKVENPYQYRGEYTDNATSMQYLRARYYRVDTGSFITADTYRGEVTTPLSLNRYTYAHNNPIMNIDPSGHFVLTALAIGAGIAAVGALIAGGSKLVSNHNAKKAQTTTNEMKKVVATSNPTIKSTNIQETTISGNKVTYKNKMYVFKSKAEANTYFSLCETLDKQEKIQKYANVAEKAGMLIAGTGIIVASGGIGGSAALTIASSAVSGVGSGMIFSTLEQSFLKDGTLSTDGLTDSLDYGKLALDSAVSGVSGGVTEKFLGTAFVKKAVSDVTQKAANKTMEKIAERGIVGLISGTASGFVSDALTQTGEIMFTDDRDSFDFVELTTSTISGGIIGAGTGALKGAVDDVVYKIGEKINRGKSVGGTPQAFGKNGKLTKYGKELVEAGEEAGVVRKVGNHYEYLDEGTWYVLKKGNVDMGHIADAAGAWEMGYYRYGNKSDEVRSFMKDLSNYMFQNPSNNRSNGAKSVFRYRSAY